LTAQKPPLKVSVSTRNYYNYQWTKESSTCEESADEDTVTKRCTWVAIYSYPYFSSQDKNFNTLINQAVSSNFDYEFPSSKRIELEGWRCLDDKPGQDLMSYKVNYNHGSFLSFTIFKDSEPSGMGNGFRHDAIPFTFDLESRKQLKLGDIIRKEDDTAVCRIVISKLKSSHSELFHETGEINNPGLFQPFSTLNYPFTITPEGVTLYFPLSFGGKYAYEEIVIKFSEYPHLFKDKRILSLKKTGKKK
jgi:hypothetical protein